MRSKAIVKCVNLFLFSFCAFANGVQAQDALRLCKKKSIGMGYGLAVYKGHVYITGNSGLMIYDIDPLKKVKKTADLDIGAPCFSVIIHTDDIAFVTGENGLTAIDISDPAGPKLLSQSPFGGMTYGISLIGQHLFVSGGGGSHRAGHRRCRQSL